MGPTKTSHFTTAYSSLSLSLSPFFNKLQNKLNITVDCISISTCSQKKILLVYHSTFLSSITVKIEVQYHFHVISIIFFSAALEFAEIDVMEKIMDTCTLLFMYFPQCIALNGIFFASVGCQWQNIHKMQDYDEFCYRFLKGTFCDSNIILSQHQ